MDLFLHTNLLVCHQLMREGDSLRINRQKMLVLLMLGIINKNDNNMLTSKTWFHLVIKNV